MKISTINNNKHITFKSNDPVESLYERSKKINKKVKTIAKKGCSAEDLEKIETELKAIADEAKGKISKVNIPKIFTNLVRWFGKIKITPTGNKALDTASRLTKVVLWGNVGKEIVGTAMYTIQALTNEDLPEDKRKFVGMYDLAVGLVSTTFSFIFGVKLEEKIKNGYSKLLKPLTDSPKEIVKSRGMVAIVGLAAFSSYFLQTIIGKRIVAPAVATPIAGKVKAKMEAADAAKKQGQEAPKTDDKTFEQAISTSNILAKVVKEDGKGDKFKL